MVAIAFKIQLSSQLVYAEKVTAENLTSEQVKTAIRNGITLLKSRQKKSGAIAGTEREDGVTALATLALLNAGVDENDPVIKNALAYLAKDVNDYVYTASLKCQVFALVDQKKYGDALQGCVDYLLRCQIDNGTWAYDMTKFPYDNSNTQFAMLGLYEASKVGVKIKKSVWKKCLKHYKKVQKSNGSWGYRGKSSTRGYGSMTAAALASLYIGGHSLNVKSNSRFQNGRALNCGKYAKNKILKKGFDWIKKHFSVVKNPGIRGLFAESWYYYYMYALERVGMITGRKYIGGFDWYRLGAAELINRQKKDGSWGTTSQTSFALLFLSKGDRPVLTQKLRTNADWNRNLHDLENLTNFIGDSFGKPTTWQIAELSWPVEKLCQSPIIIISGHKFPKFTDEQIAKLKKYVSKGSGTLIFEACCGSQNFIKGFRKFSKKAWPDFKLKKLQIDHPIYNCKHKLKKTYNVYGIGSGCKTSVFLCKRALSALWELKNVPGYSKYAFKLGENLCAYATGENHLREKLEVVELPADEKKTAERKAEIPRGAVQIARLIHTGDYNADPHAVINLAKLVKDKAKIDVVARSRHIKVTSKKLYEFPVVFMTGHSQFEYNKKQSQALKQYLEKGGFLIASNCCGGKTFDLSFRRMVLKLFPKAKFKTLDPSHPIYTGKTGINLGEVKYRKTLAKKLGSRGTNQPILEAIIIDGRAAIIYSKYDFCCGLEGDNPFGCAGYDDESSKKLALAIFLYAMNY